MSQPLHLLPTRLTEEQKNIMNLLQKPMTVYDIADATGLAVHTVRRRVKELVEKKLVVKSLYRKGHADLFVNRFNKHVAPVVQDGVGEDGVAIKVVETKVDLLFNFFGQEVTGEDFIASLAKGATKIHDDLSRIVGLLCHTVIRSKFFLQDDPRFIREPNEMEIHEELVKVREIIDEFTYYLDQIIESPFFDGRAWEYLGEPVLTEYLRVASKRAGIDYNTPIALEGIARNSEED